MREYVDMENAFKSMQSENYALREYVIHLQSRLLDAKGEYPQPPPNVNLSLGHPHGTAPPPMPLPPVSASESVAPHTSGPAAGTPLEAVAQAVANLGRSEQASESQYVAHKLKPEGLNDESRTADEIQRQLQADGLPQPQM